MIIVPVREQDACEPVWGNTHYLQTLQEILGVRIHANIHRNRTALGGHEIGACEIGRSAKTPHPFGDWYDLDIYGASLSPAPADSLLDQTLLLVAVQKGCWLFCA